MIIDHIGIVVPTLERGVQECGRILGYRQMTEILANTRQKVRVVFLHKEQSTTIKLIEPIGARSPVCQFASRGGGLHHLCFRCGDVVEEMARLESMGLRILTHAEPGEAFDGHKIGFVYAHSLGLNLELVDTDTKARRLDVAEG